MLDLNVNVMKARTILGMVSGATTVDSSYLLEDENFCTLLADYAHTLTLDDAVSRLENYVNENY